MKLRAILEDLVLSPVTRCANLSFVRVLGPDTLGDEVLLLDEALETGYFTVTDTGAVPVLLVDNRLGMNVFVPAGEILEGRTQNRAARFPTVIPARAKSVRLAVRCAEEGQPLTRGCRLTTSRAILAPSARSGEVSQEETWHTISHTIRALHVRSSTQDYSSAARTTDLADYLRAIGPVSPAQRGYIAAVSDGDEVSFYADIFGSHGIYRHFHERLWQGVATVAKASIGRRVPVKTTKSEFVSFSTSSWDVDLVEKRIEGGGAGTLYLGDESTAVSALVVEGTPMQVSLRRDSKKEEGRALDETMCLRPADLRRVVF